MADPAPQSRYDHYADEFADECWNCDGDGFVYGCSWDWQCDTYDAGEGTCLCTKRCFVCNPVPRDAVLDAVLADALAKTGPKP
jgi:hypothetical protein